MKRIAYYLALTILSTVIIFYEFPTVPLNLSFDEVEFARLALSLGNQPYTPYSSMATGHSTLYFYILLASMKLFGITSFALRLPSAVCGILSVLVFFRIMQLVFKNTMTAFLTAVIFLSLRWYFNFARFSFEATFLLFLELTSIWLLFEYEKKKQLGLFMGSAVFAGLAFHSYYPGKIFFILPLVFVLVRLGKKYALHYLIIIVLIMLPLLVYYIWHPDVRVSQISVLSDTNLSYFGKIVAIGENIRKTVLMPFLSGDMNGRHNYPGKPALNPIMGLLLIAGLLLSFPRRRESKIYSLFFLGSAVLSVIPTLISSPNDNPNMLRTFTLLPSIVYFMGLCIHRAFSWNKKYALPVISALILLSAIYELRTYFIFQSRVFRNSFEVTCPLQEMVKKETVPKKCRVKNNLF